MEELPATPRRHTGRDCGLEMNMTLSTFQSRPSSPSEIPERLNPRLWDFTAATEQPRAPPLRRPEVARAELDQLSAGESSSRPVRNWREVSETPALFSIKQRYFGTIIGVHEDYVSAQLTDERTGEYADAEIPRDMVKEEDQNLLQEGLEFVWIFGYTATTSSRQSSILYIPRFRRVTEERLTPERARVDAVMDTIFGPLDSTHTSSPQR